MSILNRIIGWFESRLRLRDSLWPLLRHPVPAALSGRVGWWYVFGSVTMTFLLLQVVTGVCLATIYEPTAEGAYTSLEYLNYQAAFGWLLRAIHYWAATGMVVMIVVHMTQVFLMGAYKYPRELTWIVGVILLVLTLALAFSGQALRFDSDAYWGVGVLASALGRIPFVGRSLVHLMLGGEFIGNSTLARFFALHVFVLPALVGGFLAVHLYLVVKRGISEPPRAGVPVDSATYDAAYAEQLRIGIPFFPDAFFRDGIACAFAVLVAVTLAVVFGPKGPGMIADPTLIHAQPRPDWYFLPLFALAALAPPSLETILILVLPFVALTGLAAVPLIAGEGERSARRRPVAVMVVLVAFVSLMILGWYGQMAPWSPQMDAWCGEPVPPSIVRRLTPLELQGAVVFQNKSCRNCHALEGSGGRRGPDLTNVGRRLNGEAMVRQVIQGGGNMPAYGKQLDRAEVDALVAFLVKLRPDGLPPAEMPATTAAKENQK